MPLTNADTRALIGAVETIHPAPAFYLDRYFAELHEFDEESIDFDVISKGRKLAPFVHPDLPGKLVQTGGMQTKSFKPAYLKPKEAIKPSRGQRRRAGEPYNGGTLSASARLEAATMETLEEQRTAIKRRKEFMAVEAIDTGQVVVDGDGFDRVIVDFGRDASLSTGLIDAARWGENGVNPLTAIKAMGARTHKLSGVHATDVVFDPMAAEIFQGDAEIRELLDIRKNRQDEFELGPVDPISSASYLGSIGIYDFFVYQDFALDDDDSEIQLMPDYTVHMLTPAVGGVQAHGAILDAEHGLQPLEIAPKVWNEQDPPVRMAMTQSAPLVVPTRVNHTGRIRVR